HVNVEVLKETPDTAYVVVMAPGVWLASKLIEHAPSLAASMGLSPDGNAVLAPLILTILSWTIAALLLRRLLYPLRSLMKAVGVMIMRIRYRTLIALRGLKTMFGSDPDSVDRPGDADGEEQTEEFKLSRLDLIVLNLAKTLGPGFALSAPELANRLNLRPDQIQECLEKLSRYSMIDHTRVMTDGYENYRLNNTGSYVLTMWEQHRARA
ncbi:MAG: hypothetical protein ACE5KS_09305, partial [Woeseiaceae bacterium]